LERPLGRKELGKNEQLRDYLEPSGSKTFPKIGECPKDEGLIPYPASSKVLSQGAGQSPDYVQPVTIQFPRAKKLAIPAIGSCSSGLYPDISAGITPDVSRQRVISRNQADKVRREEIGAFKPQVFHEEDHAAGDLIYIQAYTDLARVPSDYIDWVADAGGYPPEMRDQVEDLCAARLDNFTILLDELKGTKVWLPNFGELGIYSPLKKHRAKIPSVSRFKAKLLRLSAVAEQYEGLADYLIKWTLTTPDTFGHYSLHDLKRTEEKFWRAVKFLTKYLHKRFCRFANEKLFITVNVHPWKTTDPTGRPHWHAHISLVNTVVSDRPGGGFNFKRFNPWLDKKQLNEMLQLWKEALLQAGFPSQYVFGIADHHWQFIPLREKARVVNWLNYCARSPLVDIANYYKKHIRGKTSESPESFQFFLLEYQNRRRPYGALTRLTDYVGEIKSEVLCPIDQNPARVVSFATVADSLEAVRNGLKVIMHNPNSKRFEHAHPDKFRSWMADLAG